MLTLQKYGSSFQCVLKIASLFFWTCKCSSLFKQFCSQCSEISQFCNLISTEVENENHFGGGTREGGWEMPLTHTLRV